MIFKTVLDAETILPDAKPDFVMSEESTIHGKYPEMFSQNLTIAITRATRQQLLVTGYVTKHDPATGNELVYLIKWNRVP